MKVNIKVRSEEGDSIVELIDVVKGLIKVRENYRTPSKDFIVTINGTFIL